MRRKPWPIIMLAILHIFAPIGNLFFNAFRIGVSPTYLWNYWIYVLPKYHLLINVFFPAIAGLLIYICRKWSYWTYIFTICIIFSVSMGDLFFMHDHVSYFSVALRCVTFAANILIVSYVVVPSIRNIYLDPRLRWWEAAPRYMFVTDVSFNDSAGMSINISQGGLFLTSRKKLEESDMLQLSWSIYGYTYNAVGKVVYKSPRSASEGYGVQFQHTPESKKDLKKLIKILHAEKQLDGNRLPRPDDSFLTWASRLLKTGKGLFPKV